MTQNANPLKNFFRQPAIYMRLPSGGRFWPADSLEIPQSGELPVFPMTAVDEITYRTPDALFNGQAVVDVIHSCIPSIKNAWHTPSMDLNAILVAIRIASYGNDMDLTTTCPACSESEDFGLDLRTVLDQLRSPDYDQTITHGDLEISFRPMDYQQQNASNMKQFENQRLIQMIPNSDLPDDEKVRQMTEIMKNITDLTVAALRDSIEHIRTPNAIVAEHEFIQEFLTKCDRAVFAAIRDHAIGLRSQTDLRPVKLACSSCKHEYEQQINLDMASFFATAS
jgi:hypothetical protein